MLYYISLYVMCVYAECALRTIIARMGIADGVNAQSRRVIRRSVGRTGATARREPLPTATPRHASCGCGPRAVPMSSALSLHIAAYTMQPDRTWSARPACETRSRTLIAICCCHRRGAELTQVHVLKRVTSMRSDAAASAVARLILTPVASGFWTRMTQEEAPVRDGSSARRLP